jgi:predicted permease
VGVGRDLRYALRLLLRTPAFTVPAVASLAIGIGLNAALFSVVSAALLRPLGAAGDGTLVRIGRSQRGDGTFRSASHDELSYLRDRASSFSGVTGQHVQAIVLHEREGSRVISAEMVTDTYFSVLRVPISVGRSFAAGDDAVVVISERFWNRQFDRNPDVVGRTLSLNLHAFTIVGVASAGFVGTFPGVDVDAWLPVTMASVVAAAEQRGGLPPLMLLARLRPETSLAEAAAELEAVSARMNVEFPGRDRDRGFVVAPARGAHPLLARVARVLLTGLMAIVGIVLLLACVNVAGLMLARAAARRGELAVRLAIGAGRGRLVRQLLVESVAIAVMGGAAGTLLAFVAVHLLNGFAPITGPTGGPIALDLRLDVRVLAFTSAVTMLTALVFGLIPSLQATGTDVISTLRSPQSTFGGRPSRLQKSLVVAQVVTSCILLAGAALLFRSVRNTSSLDVGFNPDRVVVASFGPGMLGYARSKVEAYYDALLARGRTWPGMEAVALADFVPMGPRGSTIAIRAPESSEREAISIAYNRVSEGYFGTVGQRLLRGRDFSAADRSGTSPVVIVNEALARRLWSNADPLGRTIRLDGESIEREVVGVAADAKYASFGGVAGPLVYVTLSQLYRPNLTLHVRTSRPPAEALTAVRQLAGEIDPRVPTTDARTMREAMAFALVPARLGQDVLAIAGVIALCLAAGGLYGLISFTLARREQEIGIRVALGATRTDVFRAIVGRTMALVAVAVAIGLGLALIGARFLTSLLYELSPADPIAFGFVGTVMVAVTAVASYTAARRALDVDPAVVLRRE